MINNHWLLPNRQSTQKLFALGHLLSKISLHWICQFQLWQFPTFPTLRWTFPTFPILQWRPSIKVTGSILKSMIVYGFSITLLSTCNLGTCLFIWGDVNPASRILPLYTWKKRQSCVHSYGISLWNRSTSCPGKHLPIFSEYYSLPCS